MARFRIPFLFSRLSDNRNANKQLGLAWYREDQWPQLLAVSVDAARLEKTYAQWARTAQDRFDQLLRDGVRVEKVDVDVKDMAIWCKEMGHQVDGAGRAAYAAYRLSEKAGRPPI